MQRPNGIFCCSEFDRQGAEMGGFFFNQPVSSLCWHQVGCSLEMSGPTDAFYLAAACSVCVGGTDVHSGLTQWLVVTGHTSSTLHTEASSKAFKGTFWPLCLNRCLMYLNIHLHLLLWMKTGSHIHIWLCQCFSPYIIHQLCLLFCLKTLTMTVWGKRSLKNLEQMLSECCCNLAFS